MRHHHKSGAVVARQLQHQGEHAVGGGAVQIAGWLIGQHTRRVRDQRTRNGYALALAARQLCRAVRHALFQPYGLQHLRGLLQRLFFAVTANTQRHGHIVLRAELRQQVVKLVDKTQVLVAQLTLAFGAERVQGLALQVHAALCGGIQPAQQMQQSAFSRARGAHNGQRFTGMHLQINIVQHLHIQVPIFKALGDTARLQNYWITHNAAPPQDSRGWHASWGKWWLQKPEPKR